MNCAGLMWCGRAMCSLWRRRLSMCVLRVRGPITASFACGTSQPISEVKLCRQCLQAQWCRGDGRTTGLLTPDHRSGYLKVCSRDSFFEIIRHRGLKLFPFAGPRMTESKLPSMQHLARKIFDQACSIDFVTEDWVTQMMKMHANLVRASAVQSAFNQTCFFIRANDAIFGLGCPATEGSHTHSLPMDRVSSDFFFDYAGRLAQFSRHQCEINLFHGAVGELS